LYTHSRERRDREARTHGADCQADDKQARREQRVDDGRRDGRREDAEDHFTPAGEFVLLHHGDNNTEDACPHYESDHKAISFGGGLGPGRLSRGRSAVVTGSATTPQTQTADHFLSPSL